MRSSPQETASPMQVKVFHCPASHEYTIIVIWSLGEWFSQTNSLQDVVCCLVTKLRPILQSHRLQLPELLHPWDFPGQSTGVGFHFLLQACKISSAYKTKLSWVLGTDHSMMDHASELGRDSCVCNHKWAPWHLVRKTWEDTYMVWHVCPKKWSTVTRALYCSPDFCTAHHHTEWTIQPLVQLKEGFLATKTILFCSQKKSIQLAQNSNSKFWIGASPQTQGPPWMQRGVQGEHLKWGSPSHPWHGWHPRGLEARWDSSPSAGKGRRGCCGWLRRPRPRRTRGQMLCDRLFPHSPRPPCTFFLEPPPSWASWHHFSGCNTMSLELGSSHGLNPSPGELGAILLLTWTRECLSGRRDRAD